MSVVANLATRTADAHGAAAGASATVPALFRDRCEAWADRTAHREKKFGIWTGLTWRDYYNDARDVGLGLVELGISRGETVSLLSEDRREWLLCDLGIACIGAISNGIYTTDSASQLAYLLNDSRSVCLLVENEEQLDKYLAIRDAVPTVRHVIVLDREGLRDFSDSKVLFFDDLVALGKRRFASEPDRFEQEVAGAAPDDILLLIYTSGTTGPPKGAMLSHRNVLYQVGTGLALNPPGKDDQQLCFLPLCHVYERLVSVYYPLGSGATVNFAESVETVFDNLREVSPTFFAAVPRLWEKLYSQVRIRRAEATTVGRWCLDRAVQAGTAAFRARREGHTLPIHRRAWLALLDALVLRNLRAMLGLESVRHAYSGAAPIAPELLEWFHAIGVPLMEGYGATETSGVASTNVADDNGVGTVGRPLPGSELRIGANDEVLVRGPHVFCGYWNQPERTGEAIDPQGWLHTGDVGRLDNHGRLTITGRLKDIIITAGGKNVSPAEIESRLKFSPYIADAIVIGDRRPYLTCLVMIDQENVEKYAQDHQVPFNDFASLCAAETVTDLVRGEVNEINDAFARVEQLKDFRLIDVLLTAEDDELTPTMKLKRNLVEQRHKALIDSMY